MRKITHKILVMIVLSLLFQGVSGQNPSTNDQRPTTNDLSKSFRIAFYNTENLFDTIDDPKTNDADFLPGSRIAWTSERYEKKTEPYCPGNR